MKLWKSPALYFGILLILLVSGALAAPYVIDWTRYRGDIEAFGSRLTGRAVKVEGPISVRLFPWPKLAIERVTVANPKDASEPDFLAAKRIEVRMTLAGLFSGQIQVETIDIVEPVIALERMTTGRGSWQIEPQSGMLEGRLLEHIKLDQITLKGGTINLIDRSRHGRATVNQVDAVISAPGIAGPWRVRGRADYKTKLVDIALNTGAWRASDPFKFGLRIAPADGSGLVYSFDGANDGKKIAGALRIEPAAHPDGRSDAEGEFRPLVMTAKVTANFDAVSLDKIEIAPRDASQGANLLSGSAHLSLGPSITLTTDLSASRFDLDAVAGAKAKALLRAGGGLALLDGLLNSLPHQVDFDGTLKVTSLVAGGAALDDLKLSLAIGDDAVHIRELSANMPGQARGLFRGVFVSTDGGPQLLGDLSGEASSLREFVQWAWPEGREDIARIWTGSRGRLKLETQIDAGADHLRFQDAAFQLGDSLGKGSLAVNFGERPSVDLKINSNSLDFDQMVPNGIAAFAPSGEGWTSLAARFPELAKSSDLRLAAQTGELRLNGVIANDVSFDVSADDKGINIKTIEAGRVGEAKLKVSGLLAAGATSPSGSLSANIIAQDPRGLLQLLGLIPVGTRPSWSEALGATDLRITAEFKPDEGGRLATVQMAGKSGALAIDGMFSAASASDWSASEVSGSAQIVGATGAALLKLAGVSPIVAQEGAAKLTLTATGSLKGGVLTDIQADIFGARAQYQGNVALTPEGLRSHGRGGVFAGRSRALLATFGIVGSDDVLSFESDIDVAPGKITLPAIKGALGGAPVSGKITVANGAKISGDLTTGPIRLPQLLALVFMPWTGGTPDLEGPFATSFPGGLQGELWIKPASLDVFEGLSAGEAQIGVSVDSSEIRLAVAGKSEDGEDVQLEFGSKADGKGRAIDARVTFPVDLAIALRTHDGKPIAAGPMKLSARVEATGRSPAAAFTALRGSGTYEFSNASLRRIDASRFAEVMAKATSAEDVSQALSALLGGGEMAVGDGKGLVTIEGGTAAFYPITVKSQAADVLLTPTADLANGSLDLAAKVQLKTSENLPPMNVSYVGQPGALTEIADSNALESYLGFRVLERSLDELERVQREQQRIYEEEERSRKEDEARLQAYYAQRDELQRRSREVKAQRVNREIQAERATAEAERAAKEAQAMNKEELNLRLRERRAHRIKQEMEAARAKAEAARALKEGRGATQTEMSARVRELRVHRRMADDRQKEAAPAEASDDQAGAKVPDEPRPSEATRVPLPRAKSPDSNSTATIDPFQPLVLVPPATRAPEPEKFDLLDIFDPPRSAKKWLKRREQTR
jgi:uncharacterized protein involved in outer membrane biogenesis